MSTPAVAEGTRVCYLYGVVRSDRRPDLREVLGVGGAPPAFVEAGSLVAVVGAVAREDLAPPESEEQAAAWLEAAVRAHEAVLERCLEPGPVVPMRFATTLREDADVLTLLRERETELEASLERLLGRREWGVKAFLRDPDALRRRIRVARDDLAERERELEGHSPGASYLARKRLDQEFVIAGEELTAELVHVADRRLSALGMEARTTSGARPRGERRYLDGAYLVAEADEAAFQAVLAELTREHAEVGLQYELTGPWPAYNFVDEQMQQ